MVPTAAGFGHLARSDPGSPLDFKSSAYSVPANPAHWLCRHKPPCAGKVAGWFVLSQYTLTKGRYLKIMCTRTSIGKTAG